MKFPMNIQVGESAPVHGKPNTHKTHFSTFPAFYI